MATCETSHKRRLYWKQVGDFGRPIEQAEFGVIVEMNEIGHRKFGNWEFGNREMRKAGSWSTHSGLKSRDVPLAGLADFLPPNLQSFLFKIRESFSTGPDRRRGMRTSLVFRESIHGSRLMVREFPLWLRATH
jgi:hypothetical protein